MELFQGFGFGESGEATFGEEDVLGVALEHEALVGEFDGGDLVGGCFGFDAGDGE